MIKMEMDNDSLHEHKVVILTQENVSKFVSEYVRQSNDTTTKHILNNLSKKGFNLNRPIRQNGFKIIQVLLKDGTNELYSDSIPNLNDVDGDGFIIMYGANVKDKNDGIEWDLYKQKSSSKKPSKIWDVKKIIYNPQNATLKLKNTVSNGEEEIMRRQVWKGKDLAWVKHEYKLFQKGIVTSTDTGDFIGESLQAQPYPVLLHYFKQTGQKNKRKQTTESPKESPKKRKKPTPAVKKEEKKVVVKEEKKTTMDSIENQLSFLKVTNNQSNEIIIQYFAPNYGFASDSTVVMLFVKELNLLYNYYCIIDNTVQLQAKVINSNVLQVVLPPHVPGFSIFFVVGKIAYNHPLSQSNLQFSKTHSFVFVPSSLDGTLILANVLRPNQNNFYEKVPIFRHTTKNLDLSNNELKDISNLKGFDKLETLHLHNNQLTSDVVFPYLSNLRSLAITSNLINNIENFIQNLVEKTPGLVYLETTNNPCNPYFVSSKKYYRYRMIILSKFKTLEHIDTAPVTPAERQSAELFSKFGDGSPEEPNQTLEFVDIDDKNMQTDQFWDDNNQNISFNLF